MTRNLHVVPITGAWAVFRDVEKAPVSTHRTKEDALFVGRETARREGYTLVIHKDDGTVQHSETFRDGA